MLMPMRGGLSPGPLPILPPELPPELLLLVLSLSGGRVLRSLAPARAADKPEGGGTTDSGVVGARAVIRKQEDGHVRRKV